MTNLRERLATLFSTPRVRECVESLRSGEDDWGFKEDEAHRTKPYPMGFYTDDDRLYWAIGWGMSCPMWPWERWLVMRAFHAAKDRA